MIILFTLDGDGTELKFPLSCDASTTVRQALSALRAKLRAGGSVIIDLRTNQGLPLPPTETIGSLKEKQLREQRASSTEQHDHNPQQQPKAYVELFALLDGPQKAVRQCLVAAAYGRKLENPGISEDVGSSSDDVEEHDRRFTSDDDPRVKGHGGSSSSPFSSSSTMVPGLHFIRINGKFQKGYALGDVVWGGPIVTEVPLMTLAYATQMAEAVAHSEKLRSRTYDPNYTAGESSLRGVDNEDFSKYVSIAKTYGQLLKTGDKYGAQMALFPEISCLRHACSPNAVFRRAVVKPYRGIVRCANPLGMLAGDEVTVLLPKVNTLLFMLLPRERRQRLLQERYHFTCDCSRCWRGEDETELTLSGAFFGKEAKTNAALQKKLTNEMREEFDALHIFDTADGGAVDTPIGAKIPRSPHALLQFVTKYTAADAPLRLHKNHWRVCVVRVAYLRQAAFVLTAQSKEKTVPVRPFLEQRSFELALQQMTTEALFVPKGHPYYVLTFAIYKKMMAILPTNLVAALQAKSRKYPIEWESLAAGYQLWEGRGSSASADAINNHNTNTNSNSNLLGGGVQPGPRRAPPKRNGKPKGPTAASSNARRRQGGGADPLDSSFSSDGEPVIPEAMKAQYKELYGEEDLTKDDVDHDDEENEANVIPFHSESKNRENVFAVAEREAEAEEAEAAFLAEHANETDDDDDKGRNQSDSKEGGEKKASQ